LGPTNSSAHGVFLGTDNLRLLSLASLPGHQISKKEKKEKKRKEKKKKEKRREQKCVLCL